MSTAPAPVAVIIPVYNGERFIRRSLDSVLRQTLQPAEIVVVDDGSTDPTLQILAAEYPQVTVVRQSKGGPAKARNAGMRASTSELIAFLDADDWWEPGKLAAQVAVMEAAPDAVANYTGRRVVLESDGTSWDVPPVPPETLWPLLRSRNPEIPPACVMVRRWALEKVGGFDERQVGSEDWSLWVKLIKLGPFTICPEPLTDYRQSPSGLSGNADHMYNDFLKMLDDTLLAGLKGWKRALWRRRIVSYQEYKGCLTARGSGDSKTERAYMWRSLRTWPSPFWEPKRFKAFAVTLLRSR